MQEHLRNEFNYSCELLWRRFRCGELGAHRLNLCIGPAIDEDDGDEKSGGPKVASDKICIADFSGNKRWVPIFQKGSWMCNFLHFQMACARLREYIVRGALGHWHLVRVLNWHNLVGMLWVESVDNWNCVGGRFREFWVNFVRFNAVHWRFFLYFGFF